VVRDTKVNGCNEEDRIACAFFPQNVGTGAVRNLSEAEDFVADFAENFFFVTFFLFG